MQINFFKIIIKYKEDKNSKTRASKKSTIRPFRGINGISVSSRSSMILNLYKSGTLFNAKIVCICVEHKFKEPKHASKCKLPLVTISPEHLFLTNFNKCK